MLRKIIHIILALFLIVSTSGITLSMHYCSGTLVSTSINNVAKSCCDGTGGCCENKTVHIEVEGDYEIPVQVNNVSTIQLDILFPVFFALNFKLLNKFEVATNIFYDSSSPPTIRTRIAFLQTYLC